MHDENCCYGHHVDDAAAAAADNYYLYQTTDATGVRRHLQTTHYNKQHLQKRRQHLTSLTPPFNCSVVLTYNAELSLELLFLQCVDTVGWVI